MSNLGSIQDVVRSYYEARKRGDEAAALELLAPEIEIDLTESDSPYRGIYRGRAKAQSLWADMVDSWSENWIEIEKEVVAADRVIVEVRHHTRGRTSGIEAVASGAQVITVRGGKIVALKLFQTLNEALDDLGT